jgi:hypothetical protein
MMEANGQSLCFLFFFFFKKGEKGRVLFLILLAPSHLAQLSGIKPLAGSLEESGVLTFDTILQMRTSAGFTVKKEIVKEMGQGGENDNKI